MSKDAFVELRATLSENIKRLRQERGLAQERLGLEAGVDRTLISKIERQRGNPTLEVLVKIAACLQVPVTDLLQPRQQGGA
jgi:transcriptional regulator with XRE-family HTH domain